MQIGLLIAIFSGILPRDYLDINGISRYSIFLSESYLIGHIFAILFLLLIYKFWNYTKKTNLKFIIFNLIFIGCVIFLSWLKISIGVLLGVFIITIYFLSSKNFLKTFLLSISYFISLAIIVNFFKYTYNEVFIIDFFAFLKNNVNNPISYLAIEFLTLFILIYFLIKKKNISHFDKFRNVVLSLSFTCLISLIPGIFLDIEGSSAAYFSSFHFIFSLALALVFFKTNEIFKYNISSILILAVFGILFINKLIPISQYSKYLIKVNKNIVNKGLNETSKSNNMLLFKNQLDEINLTTKGNESKYIIYVDEKSLLYTMKKHNDQRATIMVIPSYTGIPTFNLFNSLNDSIFLGNKKYLSNIKEPFFWGINKKNVLNKNYKNFNDFKYVFKDYKIIYLGQKVKVFN